ncbi:hypothetical protein LIER_08627 [Lithospermum erythrorhizon]|uniref:Retrotransposon gag domain-containing protein n=1 Tax=Lithospermum erythrorhizon TaxID=34254 RepID=A0AAV3PFL7_LITER
MVSQSFSSASSSSNLSITSPASASLIPLLLTPENLSTGTTLASLLPIDTTLPANPLPSLSSLLNSMTKTASLLYGYVDGSIPCPPSHVSVPNGSILPNSAYDLWLQHDQLLMSLLISSLSEDTIPLVVGKPTSQSIWNTLHTALANPSFTTHMSLQEQLMALHQDNMTVAAYLKHAKVTYDALVNNLLMRYFSCIFYTVFERTKDVKNIVYSRGPQLTYEELHNLLLTHEFVNPLTQQREADSASGLLPTPPPTGNFATRDNNHSTRDATNSHKQRCFICESTMHFANACPHRSTAHQPTLLMHTVVTPNLSGILSHPLGTAICPMGT